VFTIFLNLFQQTIQILILYTSFISVSIRSLYIEVDVMSLNTFIVIFVFTLNCETFLIDKTIREFRQDYRKFQSVSMRTVDREFFNVYNAFKLRLSEAVKPLLNFRATWKNLCKDLTTSKLDNSTAIRWRVLCSNINSLTSEILSNRDSYLMILYSGELTALTPPASIVQMLFYDMEFQMDELWKIYIKNSSCVAPFMGYFIPSYEPIVDNIAFFTNNARNISSYK
jgi:hypothetical protein